MVDPDAPSIQAHHRVYVQHHWASIAAFAWRCYLLHGRGVVSIVVHGGAYQEDLFVFVAEPTIQSYANVSQDPFIAGLALRTVMEYDPAVEVVVIIKFPTEPQPGIFCAVGSDAQASPPMCYRRNPGPGPTIARTA